MTTNPQLAGQQAAVVAEFGAMIHQTLCQMKRLLMIGAFLLPVFSVLAHGPEPAVAASDDTEPCNCSEAAAAIPGAFLWNLDPQGLLHLGHALFDDLACPGQATTYTWVYGDGDAETFVNPGIGPNTYLGRVSHQYCKNGTYLVKLVIDVGEQCPPFILEELITINNITGFPCIKPALPDGK